MLRQCLGTADGANEQILDWQMDSRVSVRGDRYVCNDIVALLTPCTAARRDIGDTCLRKSSLWSLM